MKHKILLEVTVNEDWSEYVDGSMNKELIAEDLFPYEARKEGVLFRRSSKAYFPK